jgi:hypothetical protein
MKKVSEKSIEDILLNKQEDFFTKLEKEVSGVTGYGLVEIATIGLGAISILKKYEVLNPKLAKALHGMCIVLEAVVERKYKLKHEQKRPCSCNKDTKCENKKNQKKQ